MFSYCIIKYFDARPVKRIVISPNRKTLEIITNKLNKKSKLFSFKVQVNNGEFDYLPADIVEYVEKLKKDRIETKWEQTEMFKVG